MRSFLILSLSAVVLTGCLTSQENPNYEHSTTYRGDQVGQNQYADATSVASAPVIYQPAAVSYEPATDYQGVPVQPVPQYTSSTAATVMATAPTDSVYGASEVTGTPGFMAMQSAQQSVTTQAVAETLPAAEYVSAAPIGAAGTPIAYDYSRNLVQTDAATTGQKTPDTVRIIGQSGQIDGYAPMGVTGQNYTVKQGDTVYSLSRKTCVGVNVIQSMNGLSNDFAIKIGQPLMLPTSVC